jgi:hypothetical protein
VIRTTASLLTASVLLASCAHHLRYEPVDTREEPSGPEIITESEPLVVTVAETHRDLVVRVERGVFVEQDFVVIREANEVVAPWSGFALVQLGLMSWNPLAWLRPRLWSEPPEKRDHPLIRDWLHLWNPFLRTGGSREEVRQRVVTRHATERRQLNHLRLPLNQTEVSLVISGASERETLTRTTDNSGTIHIAPDLLSPVLWHARPITVDATVEGRGTQRAQLF